MRESAPMKLVTVEFFLNNEKHEKPRKNFMEVAFSARMCCARHEIFSCPLVSFVVKKHYFGNLEIWK